MYQNLLVFQKMYDFMIYFSFVLLKFPKTHKHTLGEKIENCFIDCLLLIIQINTDKDNVDVLCKKLVIKLDSLRILIRMSKDLKLISIKKYDICCDKLNEEIRLLKGWQKCFKDWKGKK